MAEYIDTIACVVLFDVGYVFPFSFLFFFFFFFPFSLPGGSRVEGMVLMMCCTSYYVPCAVASAYCAEEVGYSA